MSERNLATLLAAYRVVPSLDVKRLHAFVTGIEGAHERRVDGQPKGSIELRHVALDQVRVALARADFRMTVAAERGTDRSYLLQFPLTGEVAVTVDGQELRIDPTSGLVMSPGSRVTRTGEPGWTLVLAIDRSLVCTRLAARLGRTMAQAPKFRPRITTAAPELREYCLMLAEAIDRGVLTKGAATTSILEAGLADLLLSLQPHDHAGAEVGARHKAATQRIEAIDRHLRANPGREMTLAEMAKIAKCSNRALQTTFLEYLGTSPLDHVRKLRLTRARELLESGTPHVTVAEVARRTGFTHLGRFAASYRRAFGEPPSTTLQLAIQRTRRDR